MQLPFILAQRFVAGETLAEALATVKRLNDRGLMVTLDMLGEYVPERSAAEEAAHNYIHLIHVLANERDQAGLHIPNVSVKPSVLGLKLDEGLCRTALQRLMVAAKDRDVFIRLDMEGSDLTDATLRIFEDFFADYPDHMGIVLQAYLKRTLDDVRRMCEIGAQVRLCKGAYKEPEEIAFQETSMIRQRFLEYAEILLTSGNYPAIATHDDLILTALRRFIAEHSIRHQDFEFQMLYGIRTDTQVQLAAEGYRMRVYVPYGSDWLPYFYRRLRERKENVWFVLKNLFQK